MRAFTLLRRKQLRDVAAGTQDVGNYQLKCKRPGDITYRLGDVHGGVVRLSEEQRHDYRRGMAGLGELPGGRLEVWLSPDQGRPE